jgi:beta-lactamase superfamily II metal-dependent hydrolase
MQTDVVSGLRVRLLDMGTEKFGDCILCQYKDTTVLIDGGHQYDIKSRNGYDSIPDQLEKLLGPPPFKISLLVVTHCHTDHIGCLPEMVAQDMLQIDWALVADENLGFGHGPDQADTIDGSGLPPAAKRAIAALREESRDDLPDAALQEFLDAAAKLEPRYQGMVKTLEAQLKSRFIRYQGKKPTALEKAFANIGLEILGPTQDHLLLCAEALAQLAQDAVATVRELTGGAEAGDAAALTDVALYRAMANSAFSDASDRPGKGAALNDQSIVLKIATADAKVLLTGDMQFAKPQIRGLDDYMSELRKQIADDAREAPFDFVKMAHHASYNGFDESVFEDWEGTVRFGISGGIRDATHPDPGVLALLKRLKAKDESITWARTDRNGLITVTFGAHEGIEISRGRLNSATPNTGDFTATATVAQPPGAPTGTQPETRTTPQPFVPTPVRTEDAHISATFPYLGSRVTLTVNLEPLGGAVDVGPPPPPPPPNGPWVLAGGRTLPKLLFLTSRDSLRRNLGQLEADAALKMISDAGQTLVDTVPNDAVDPSAIMGLVRPHFPKGVRGVVIVGGYDVVPASRLDALDPPLRAAISGRTGDPDDDFMVWSDALYGDADGDQIGELPVSRIPDAKTPDLVYRALRSGSPTASGAGGIHNIHRPYATKVYETLRGAAATNLLVSEKTQPGDPRFSKGVLSASAIYIMLHGDFQDAQRFWGEYEASGAPLEAINVDDIPPIPHSVVFCGACWGGLTVIQRAVNFVGSGRPSPRAIGSSMALTFLNAGAGAFIGCTGSHYSPEGGDTSYYGAPLHLAFWKRLAEGASPAEALFQAKTDYIAGIPHRKTSDPVDKARELKILRQFTCLGLGW